MGMLPIGLVDSERLHYNTCSSRHKNTGRLSVHEIYFGHLTSKSLAGVYTHTSPKYSTANGTAKAAVTHFQVFSRDLRWVIANMEKSYSLSFEV
jgi:hypothetical protein